MAKELKVVDYLAADKQVVGVVALYKKEEVEIALDCPSNVKNEKKWRAHVTSLVKLHGVAACRAWEQADGRLSALVVPPKGSRAKLAGAERGGEL